MRKSLSVVSGLGLCLVSFALAFGCKSTRGDSALRAADALPPDGASSVRVVDAAGLGLRGAVARIVGSEATQLVQKLKSIAPAAITVKKIELYTKAGAGFAIDCTRPIGVTVDECTVTILSKGPAQPDGLESGLGVEERADGAFVATSGREDLSKALYDDLAVDAESSGGASVKRLVLVAGALEMRAEDKQGSHAYVLTLKPQAVAAAQAAPAAAPAQAPSPEGGAADPAALASAAQAALDRGCKLCHSGNSNSGGINYITDLKKLVAKNKVKRVLARIKDTDDPMPPSDSGIAFSAEDKQAVEAWVAAGAPTP